MTDMDAFCSQCQERPEEGPCPVHDGLADTITTVLAEHAYVPSGLRGVSRCACGEPFHGMPHDHRRHVASMLAVLLAVRGVNHAVHVTATPVAEDAVWCDRCEEWVMSSAPERVAGERSRRHREAPDTMWLRLRVAEESAAYRLALVKSVIAFVDANNGDLPLTLLEEMRAEAQR